MQFCLSENGALLQISEVIRLSNGVLHQNILETINYNSFIGMVLKVSCKSCTIPNYSIPFSCSQLLDFNCTIGWNFMDIFSISVSVLLSVRFKQILKRIELLVQHQVKLLYILNFP